MPWLRRHETGKFPAFMKTMLRMFFSPVAAMIDLDRTVADVDQARYFAEYLSGRVTTIAFAVGFVPCFWGADLIMPSLCFCVFSTFVIGIFTYGVSGRFQQMRVPPQMRAAFAYAEAPLIFIPLAPACFLAAIVFREEFLLYVSPLVFVVPVAWGWILQCVGCFVTDEGHEGRCGRSIRRAVACGGTWVLFILFAATIVPLVFQILSLAMSMF